MPRQEYIQHFFCKMYVGRKSKSFLVQTIKINHFFFIHLPHQSFKWLPPRIWYSAPFAVNMLARRQWDVPNATRHWIWKELFQTAMTLHHSNSCHLSPSLTPKQTVRVPKWPNHWNTGNVSIYAAIRVWSIWDIVVFSVQYSFCQWPFPSRKWFNFQSIGMITLNVPNHFDISFCLNWWSLCWFMCWVQSIWNIKQCPNHWLVACRCCYYLCGASWHRLRCWTMNNTMAVMLTMYTLRDIMTLWLLNWWQSMWRWVCSFVSYRGSWWQQKRRWQYWWRQLLGWKPRPSWWHGRWWRSWYIFVFENGECSGFHLFFSQKLFSLLFVACHSLTKPLKFTQKGTGCILERSWPMSRWLSILHFGQIIGEYLSVDCRWCPVPFGSIGNSEGKSVICCTGECATVWMDGCSGSDVLGSWSFWSWSL